MFCGAALLPIAAAGQAWNKPPQSWKLDDTYRILQDSPWAPVKAEFRAELVWIQRHTSPLTRQPSQLPEGPTEEVRAVKLASRARPLPAVAVLWRSARTVRLAQQRQQQLRGELPANAALHAEPLDTYVVRVEGGEALRILRDAGEDLRATVYLHVAFRGPPEGRDSQDRVKKALYGFPIHWLHYTRAGIM
ncbi:MAG: hypothetical protein ACRD5G_07800 [Candidatus Acidiferrales bacterium]